MSSENYFSTSSHDCSKAGHGHKCVSLKINPLVAAGQNCFCIHDRVLNEFSGSRSSWTLRGDTVFQGFLQNEAHTE